MRSIRLALRVLGRTPFVTSVAIASLALGIGANTAIFSIFNQILLRPLPVTRPAELVNLSAPGPKPGNQSCNQAGDCDEVFSYAMFRDLEKAQTVFTGLAAHVLFGANLSSQGQTSSTDALMVSGSYFPVLGIQPAAGRLLGPQDDGVPGEPHVAVVSHAYWKLRLGSDPNVVGQPITVNGVVLTIVGVAPEGFNGTTVGGMPRVFVPMTLRPVLQPNGTPLERRDAYWAYLFARLAPGVTLEQARAQINGPYRQILADVELPLQQNMTDQTKERFKAKEIGLVPGPNGQSSIPAEARAPLTLLLGVTAFVLLIACANIANLLLARSAARAGEMAVRLSLGASRGQLVRQLLLESSLLAVFGGVISMPVAYWTMLSIQAMLPSDAASTAQAELSPTVLLVTAVLTAGTGILFGLFPALHSTRPDLVSSLKNQAGQPSGSRSAARFRTTLATAQIALSMALLAAAGLFMRSLVNVSRADLGLNPEGIVTFTVSPGQSGYSGERSHQLFARIERELAALPGVTGVTSARVPLLAGSNSNNSVSVEGYTAAPDENTGSRFNEIGPAYFATTGVKLLDGREFTAADALTTPKVAVVNEAFAKRFNLGHDVVGRHISSDGKRGGPLDVEIVGLVQNAKYSEVKAEFQPTYFRPYRQNERARNLSFYVRTSSDAEEFLGNIPKLMHQIDPDLPVDNLRTLPQQIRENVFLDRFVSVLSASFAALATLLAAIGLYGVLAYTVSQRTREIGLRMALGAAPGIVRGMILRQVAWMTGIGAAVGLALALVIGRLASSLFYQMTAGDPGVLAGAVVALAFVALGAGFIPALRASQVDPMTALRIE